MIRLRLGLVYPCLAGLDSPRQPLYLNLCALVALAFAARLLLYRLAGYPDGVANLRPEDPAA